MVCKQDGSGPAIPCRLWVWMEGKEGKERKREGMASEVERDTLPGLRLRPEQTCGGAAESTIDTVV